MIDLRGGERSFEIVAPAGDAHSMAAAVQAGADAVYFGFQAFNARSRAANFTGREVLQAIGFLRERGVRSYVALNTAVFEHEVRGLEGVLTTLARTPPDAVIFQDLAVVELARRILPGTDLHASTQTGVCDLPGLRAMAALGASRVVVARELSGGELEFLAGVSPVEVEVFVFGAMCASVSGYCYASLCETGRSGNRGACSQVCRSSFGGCRPFSMRDLDLLDELGTLCRMGIRAFKIEGRMKGADYVHAAVTALRTVRDGCFSPSSVVEARARLADVLLRQRGTGWFHFPSGERFAETGHQVHSEAGEVVGARGRKVVVGKLRGAALAKGSRVRIRGSGATVLSSRDGVLTLSRAVACRKGDAVMLAPDRGRVPGLESLVESLKRRPTPATVDLFLDVRPGFVRAELSSVDGRLLARLESPADTSPASGTGVGAEAARSKLAHPSLVFRRVEVSPNRLVVRHRLLKDMARTLAEDVERALSLPPRSASDDYPPFYYSEARPDDIVLPPVRYPCVSGVGGQEPPPGDVAGTPGRRVVLNNIGQCVTRFPAGTAVATGRFLPVLNRVAAAVWARLGATAFLRPYEAGGAGTPPLFLVRQPPERLPDGFDAEELGDAWAVVARPGARFGDLRSDRLPTARNCDKLASRTPAPEAVPASPWDRPRGDLDEEAT